MGCDIHNTLIAYDKELGKLVDILHRPPTEEEEENIAVLEKLKAEYSKYVTKFISSKIKDEEKKAHLELLEKISEAEKKIPYYDQAEIEEMANKFKPFFDGRSYEFFSLFGVRGTSEYEIFDGREKFGKHEAVKWPLEDCHTFCSFKVKDLIGIFKDIMKRASADIEEYALMSTELDKDGKTLEEAYEEDGEEAYWDYRNSSKEECSMLQWLYGSFQTAVLNMESWLDEISKMQDKYDPGSLEVAIWFDN